MSVDFFPCDACGESVCDCGDYWTCEECEHRLCVGCRDKHVREVEPAEDSDDGPVELCPYCTGVLATDAELLAFALTRLRTTRAALLKTWQESRPAKRKASR